MVKYVKADTNTNMTIDEFLTRVKNIYNSVFPDSECVAELGTNLGGYIYIRWLLSADSSETANNIRDNDMLHIRFFIHDGFRNKTVDDEMPSELEVEVSDKLYFIKPENRYLAYGSRNLPFRKIKGTPDKVLDTLDRYAHKLKDMLEADLDADNIHSEHIDLVQRKLGR